MARSPAEQIFDSLMVSATLPLPEREAHAGQALAAIVGHARQTVPYYRDRLDGVIGADGRIDREAWHALPPLSRHDLQDHKDALTSTRCPALHGEIHERSTSGTTGTELRITRAGPLGAPHPMGMNRPNISSTSTMAGEHFQNKLKGTMRSFTSPKRITR